MNPYQQLFARVKRGTRMRVMAAFAVVGLAGVAAPAAESARMQLLSGQRNVFADEPAVFRVAITGEESFTGRLLWSFSVGNGVIARREIAVDVRRGTRAVHDIRIDMPPFREAMVTEALLSLALEDSGGALRADMSSPVYVLGRDPFAFRKNWLEERNLRVFDPAGETAAALDALNIPYRAARNPAAFEDMGKVTLLIGEGLSLLEYRGLMASALRAARNGVAVIFLAPAEGRFPVWGESGEELPESLTFRGGTILNRLDKRLDASHWTGDATVDLRTFRLEGERGVVEIVAGNGSGWSWIEAGYSGRGAIVICGFPLLPHWEESPTPRHLLARILEHITPKEEK